MGKVTIIGVDLAKNVFQLDGAAADEAIVFRKALSRPQFARFMGNNPAYEVPMEACPSAHDRVRDQTDRSHRVWLIAPNYVQQAAEKVSGLERVSAARRALFGGGGVAAAGMGG